MSGLFVLTTQEEYFTYSSRVETKIEFDVIFRQISVLIENISHCPGCFFLPFLR